MRSAKKPRVQHNATVVLVHGLYMHGFAMSLLAQRLRRAGYRTMLFSYASLRKSVPVSAQALATRVSALDSPIVHFVAHSLGGLVVRHLLNSDAELPAGRVVTLGTPHQGSGVARLLSHSKLKIVLGRSTEQGLLALPSTWPDGHELGSLAGTHNVGLGRLFAVAGPADGTVTVAETYLPGMTDHICLPVTHTSMLFSALVAEQVDHFLKTGCFFH